MQDYKRLKVWNDAHILVVSIYQETKYFPREETYGLMKQIRRAAYSIPANIAEGCGRNSRLDFANFLNIAMGSANETEYFLTLSFDLKYIESTIYKNLLRKINEIKAMLLALIKKVRA